MSKTKQTNSLFKNGLQLFVILLLLVGVFLLATKIYRSVQKYRTINKEVIILKNQADKFDRENKKLNKLVDYFSSDDFQEKEIKEKLNLVKEGEKVVLIQGIKNNVSQNVKISDQQSDVNIKHAYYYYWWKYFFGGDKFNN